MSEIMRFRIARSPQRLVPDPFSLVDVERQPAQLETHVAPAHSPFIVSLLADRFPAVIAQNFVDGSDFVRPGATLAAPADLLPRLDHWLAAHADLVEPAELAKQIPGDAAELISAASWWVERRRVSDSLIAALFAGVDFDTRRYLARLMLLFGLVELFAENQNLLQDREAIYEALRWRTISVPAELVEVGDKLRAVLARRPGFSDLYVVRDEWVRYAAGEIAHIENVLSGESKERLHRRTDETEVTTLEEQERVELNERDTQTTDRFELSEQASRDIQLAAHIEGKVDTSGQYGPTHVDTHLGGSFDYSMAESQARATNQARESVTRAVTRVEERVRQVRLTRTLTRIEESNKHVIDNTGGSQHVVGIYRWVDKIQRLQLFRYPHRLLLEFQLPEPASFKRWLQERGRDRGLRTKEPEPLIALSGEGAPVLGADGNPKELTPADILPITYQQYVSRYQVLGVEAPPAARTTVSLTLELAAQNESLRDESKYDLFNDAKAGGNGLQVPPGYRAVAWTAGLLGHAVLAADPEAEDPNAVIPRASFVTIMVGTSTAQLRGDPPGVLAEKTRIPLEGATVQQPSAAGPLTGRIPVAVLGLFTKAFEVNIILDCELLPERLSEWQFETYEAIANAYWALKRQHEEERAALSVSAGVEIAGESPARNREVIREELKRQAIEMLTGSVFTGRPGVVIDPAGAQRPQVDFQAVAGSAPEIQFIEQAFEWENLTYVLYPYFWADDDSWPGLAELETTDPDYARFLRAGSARVVLPARPGFESQVLLYTALGTLWGGGPTPVPGSELYLSVAEEIKAQQRAPRDGVPGESWEVRLPTTLTWLDSQNDSLPVENPDSELDPPPGR